MPAVSTQPLMDSPRWGAVPAARRKQLLLHWQDPATTDADRAEMLQMMQQPAPGSQTALGPAAQAEPVVPMSPWEALKSAWRGEQRMPWQAAPPEEGRDPAAMVRPALEQALPGGKVVSGALEAMASPSSVGEALGTLAVPGPWKPVAGAAGAALGEGVRQWQAGEALSPSGMLREGLASAVPEVLESAGRGALRQVARQSPGGQRIIGTRATEEARQVPEHVFAPRPAEEISQAFEQVRRTQLPIDTSDMTRHLTTLSPGKRDDVRNILAQIDTRNRTGGRYGQLFERLLAGPAGQVDIGALQTMRSDVRKYAQSIPREAGEARLLVRNLQDTIDDTIDYGLVHGAQASQAPAIRDQLHQARRDYAHRMAADDLSELIEDKIRSSGNLRDEAFSLRGLWDELRKGRTEASRSINRSLDLTPGARDRFQTDMERLTRHYENVALPMTDVQGIWRYPGAAAVRQGLSSLLLTERGRQMFEQALIEGRGRLSPNTMATLLNAARRELLPELTQGTAEARGLESWTAPGGIARSTD